MPQNRVKVSVAMDPERLRSSGWYQDESGDWVAAAEAEGPGVFMRLVPTWPVLPDSAGLIVTLREPVVDHFVEHAERLVRELPLNQVELLKLGSREFEELIACAWRKFGYEVELTARTRDGGYDVVAVRRAELGARILIECKRYSAEQRLDVGLVRSLYGVKVDQAATKAILATTATFSKDAVVWAERHKWELELRDYLGVLDWLKQARRSKVN